MGALDAAVRAGKALYVGVSSYSARAHRPRGRDPARALARRWLIHQPSYSMFNRWIEGGLLDVLESEGVGCIAFTALAQGLLSNRYLGGVPADSRAAAGKSLDPGTITTSQPSTGSGRSTPSPSLAGRPSPSWRSPGCCAIRGSPRP